MIPAWTRRLLRPLLGKPDVRLQQMIYKAYLRGLAESSQKSLGDPVLPSGFGKRLPERVVELLLARLSYNPGKKVLDVGHAYIMDCHRQLVTSLPAPRHLTGIDIADPTYNTQSVYERSLKADITNSGLPDNSFDLIWCISTLEHLGMDNSGYTPSFAMGDHMAAQALREMLRLVAPGGHVLITVPFGKFENHGWFMNLDRDRWQSLLSIAKPYASVTECYFHHTAAAGWSRVNAEELSNVGYYDEQNAGAAALAVAYITKTSGE